MPVLHSVRTPRVPVDIVQQIQEAIFNGEWRPGDKLPPERELVRQFETSRGSLREAIRVLEMSGMLVVRRGSRGGMVVAQPTFQMASNALLTTLRMNKVSIEELYQARIILEPVIIEMAALKADAQDIAALDESLNAIKRLASSGKPTSSESYRLHFLIAQASKSRLLAMLASSVIDLVRLSDIANAHDTVDPQIVVTEHLALVEAIRERNPAEARQLMIEHLSHLLAHICDEARVAASRADPASS